MITDISRLSCIGNDVFLDKQVLFRSYVTNIIINVVTYMSGFYLPTKEHALFYDFVLNIIFVYVTDILFVQKNFKNFTTNTLGPRAYSDIWFRINYMLRMRIILKYAVVVTISTITITSIRRYVYKKLQQYQIVNETETGEDDTSNESKHFYKYLAINILIKFAITVLFLNFLKFRWAYIDNDDIYLTAIIISLLTLSILLSISK